MSRYHVSSSEGQYEKDSSELVLANKLGISDYDEIDGAELVLLEQLFRVHQHKKIVALLGPLLQMKFSFAIHQYFVRFSKILQEWYFAHTSFI